MKNERNEDFNVFKNLGLNENQHSNFLKKLLNPRGKHGQGNLFLKEFIAMTPVLFDEKSEWKVSTGVVAGERGFVDLFLHNKQHTIIIENKIHDAKNQDHQLYRYWKNHIYDKEEYELYCKEKDGDLRNVKTNYEHYYKDTRYVNKYSIIYLTKSELKDKQKSKDDFKKSKIIHPYYKSKHPDLPEVLPMSVIELNYKEHIFNWLNKCQGEISNKTCSDETKLRLKKVIEQYIEFIKNYL